MSIFFARIAVNFINAYTVLFEQPVEQYSCSGSSLAVNKGYTAKILNGFKLLWITFRNNKALNPSDAFDKRYTAVRKILFNIAFVIFAAFRV